MFPCQTIPTFLRLKISMFPFRRSLPFPSLTPILAS